MSVTSISSAGNSSYVSMSRTDEAQKNPGQSETTNRTDDLKPTRDESRTSVRDESSETYGPTGRLPQKPEAPEQVADTEKSGKTDQDQVDTSAKSGESEHTPEEEKEIEKLENRDTEVKAHEQAHIAAGGRYVRSGAHFEYQTGPDGKKYAVGGEVSIDVSKESGDPQATVAKMQTVMRAALAPANPSSQDRAVAAKASRIEMEARAEAMAEVESESEKNDGEKQKAGQSSVSDAYTTSMDSSAKTSLVDFFI